ncbi:MAG TPA: universal stress protein [Candidatus Binataceae bacterium]|nr:universal stress protein [Candidatus Binataceae bacterium]
MRRNTAKSKSRKTVPSAPSSAPRTVFRKILCPIDFDRISIPALKLAHTIARQNGARIYLLYVIPAALRAELEPLAEKNLLAVTRKWLEGKVPNEVIVRTGKPVEGVLKAAQELDADLVVMATHGRTGARRARLGSVTEEVVRRSTRPVMTIHPG